MILIEFEMERKISVKIDFRHMPIRFSFTSSTIPSILQCISIDDLISTVLFTKSHKVKKTVLQPIE